jgi:hypothetical protein
MDMNHNEQKKRAFMKMRTRMITNRLREEVEAQQRSEAIWNGMTPLQRIEALNIAYAEWAQGC